MEIDVVFVTKVWHFFGGVPIVGVEQVQIWRVDNQTGIKVGFDCLVGHIHGADSIRSLYVKYCTFMFDLRSAFRYNVESQFALEPFTDNKREDLPTGSLSQNDGVVGSQTSSMSKQYLRSIQN